MPQWRKAQRRHQCHGDACTNVIAPGDRYLDEAVIHPTKTHRRYCQECAEPVWAWHNGRRYFRGRNDFPDRYQQRIASAEWKRLKRELINQRGNNCERCGQGGGLHLHHRTYARLGDELPEDVELLCHPCHMKADQERQQEGARARVRRRRGQCSSAAIPLWRRSSIKVTAFGKQACVIGSEGAETAALSAKD
jgi:hypothetical protein